MKFTMRLIAVMLASLFRTAALRVPDRVIVHFDVALVAVRNLRPGPRVAGTVWHRGPRILYLRLMLVSEALALAEDPG
jgi:hypothetical protein